MKKSATLLAVSLFTSAAIAQPVLNSNSLQAGPAFKLYALTNVNNASLSPIGPNATWNLGAATATQVGTARMLSIDLTPYAAQYPAATFAIEIVPTGSPAQYSLYDHTAAALEQVADSVGTSSQASFTNYRNSLPFPFTFGSSVVDTYQRSSEVQKIIVNTYDAYGTFITPTATYTNTVRNTIVDDGVTSYMWWNSSPLVPLFQASNWGFILWVPVTTGIDEVSNNPVFDYYPNPAANTLNIINKQLVTNIEIYNLAGQLQLATSRSCIDISSFAAGTYLIKAYTATGVASQKFIKK
jgi:hypothetical protein